MITYRELSRPLRLALAAPWCLLLGLACAAATPSFRQLLLDPATDQPISTVSLSGPRWTGTLSAARLPTDPVEGKSIAPNSIDSANNVTTGGSFGTRSGGFAADDFGVSLAGSRIADNAGNLFAVNSLSAPTVSATLIRFSDNSELFVDSGQLTWFDQSGNVHILAFAQ